jgi:hypothetical protein
MGMPERMHPAAEWCVAVISPATTMKTFIAEVRKRTLSTPSVVETEMRLMGQA